MANRCTNPNPLLPARGKKFDVNFRTQGKIRDGEQAHPNIAEIDAECIHAGRSCENLHGSVQQLALLAAPVGSGVTFENHSVHLRSKVTQHIDGAKVTEVDAFCGRESGGLHPDTRPWRRDGAKTAGKLTAVLM